MRLAGLGGRRRVAPRRYAVVAREHDQAQGLADPHRPRLVHPEGELGRPVVPPLVADAPEVGAHLRRDGLRVEQVVGAQRAVRALGPAVRGQGPDDLLVAEVGGHVDGEEEHVAAGVEVRGLPPVRPAGLDVVVGPDRHVQLFLPVRVHVAEVHAEGAVLVRPPPLVGGVHALPPRVREAGLGGRRRRKRQRQQRDDRNRPDESTPGRSHG